MTGTKVLWAHDAQPCQRLLAAAHAWSMTQGNARDPGLVLVLNSGSSSVKFALLDPGSGQRVLDGMADEELMIARDTARLIGAGDGTGRYR